MSFKKIQRGIQVLRQQGLTGVAAVLFRWHDFRTNIIAWRSFARG